MPISIDRFEGDADVRDLTTPERILRFLVANDDAAYTRQEIADAIDAAPETVGTNLGRLKDRDLVRHREPYWAFTDDREHAVDTLRARYGEERLDALLDPSWADSSDAVQGTPREGAADSESSGPDEPSTPETDDAGEPSETEPASTPESPDRRHREAAATFTDRVATRLGDRVDALYLLGSVANGTETASSDVDVLAVVADDADLGAVDERLLDLAYDVQLDVGVPVEVHSMRAHEFAARTGRGEPFVGTVVEEGERLA